MITLCGFAVSNYYNKVKLILLEKGIPFTEELVMPGRKDEGLFAASPLGKVPFIRTPEGTLCESSVIAEYLEELQAQPSLLPGTALQRGKVRELCTFVDLHLELVARELYAQAFFGGTVSEGTQARVRRQLAKNIPAFQRLAQFKPYLAGETFTLADCAAYASLPVVAMATKAVLGQDMLAEAGVDWKSYIKRLSDRPSVQRVAADRKAAQDAQMAAITAKATGG